MIKLRVALNPYNIKKNNKAKPIRINQWSIMGFNIPMNIDRFTVISRNAMNYKYLCIVSFYDVSTLLFPLQWISSACSCF